jgi:hypothetical protein
MHISVTLKGSLGTCRNSLKRGAGKMDAQGMLALTGWERSIHGPLATTGLESGSSMKPCQPEPGR